MPRISDFPIKSTPSSSATLAGLDGGENVQIPISSIQGGSTGDHIDVSTIGGVNYMEFDNQSGYIETDDGGLLVDTQGMLRLCGGEFVRVASQNTMSLSSDGAGIDFLPESDLELYAEGLLNLYSEYSVGLHSTGDMRIESAEGITIDTPGYLGMYGDQTGLYGINCIEFLAGPNDESYLYATGDMMQITSPQTTINNVNTLSTKANGKGQPGQVLTTNGSTVYWTNPSGGGSGSSPMMEVSYFDLRYLRDMKELIPGMFYKITDYYCSTNQDGTRAMQHNFHIIVQALSCDTLSEIAKADLNTTGTDDYFIDAGAKVSAWELKYCLDNDTTRFAWAVPDCQYLYLQTNNIGGMFREGDQFIRYPANDSQDPDSVYKYAWASYYQMTHHPSSLTDIRSCLFTDTEYVNLRETRCIVFTQGDDDWVSFHTGDYFDAELDEDPTSSGRGVIYYMRDEHGNECPYDFKNIQFMRCISLENGYPELDEENGEDTWVYTFCGTSHHIMNDEWSELKDGSLESPYMHQSDERQYTFQNNSMKPYYMDYDLENEDYTKCGKQWLNNNVFFGFWDEVGSDDPQAEYVYHYPYCCAFHTLGYNCYDNTFSYGCKYNTLGDVCFGNVFKEFSCYNTFGSDCSENAIICGSYNTFGDNCWYNTFDNSSYNTMGKCGSDNSFIDSDYNHLCGCCYFNIFVASCDNYVAKRLSNSEVHGSNNFYACKINNESLAHNDSFVMEI